MNPAGEPEPVGYAALAPVDDFLQRHRIGVVAGTSRWRSLGLPLLYWLAFDFDPIHLRSPQVGVGRDLARPAARSRRRRQRGQRASRRLARRSADASPRDLRKMPEVERAMTLAELRPGRSGAKARADPRARRSNRRVAAAAGGRGPAPTDAENVEALTKTAARLKRSAGDASGPGRRRGATPRRRSDEAGQGADRPARQRAAAAFLVPLKVDLGELRELPAGRAGHAADIAAPSLEIAMDRAGRQGARAGLPEGRSERHRRCCAGSRSAVRAAYPDGDRRADLDPRIRRDDRRAPSSTPASTRCSRSRSCCGSCCAASATCC